VTPYEGATSESSYSLGSIETFSLLEV